MPLMMGHIDPHSDRESCDRTKFERYLGSDSQFSTPATCDASSNIHHRPGLRQAWRAGPSQEDSSDHGNDF